MKKINIGLLGLGTVGRGVADIIGKNGSEINTKAQSEITVKKALVRDVTKAAAYQKQFEITTEASDVLNDPDIHIIVEVMGGIEPAREYILQALRNKKSVVTANKDLLSVHGEEIFQVAAENGQDVFFEGSVAGGIPIINTIRQSLTANDITSVMGIINGTTNYILTAMTEQNRDFEDVLKEAQDLGYAESDPTADVEGLDAARKLSILATLSFHAKFTFNDVYVEGISKISSADIAYAEELDCVIKLLAIGKQTEGGVELRVHPTLLPKVHPLATVRDVFNAVYVVGDALGESMYFGKGAGSQPTGSAVVADIIQIVRNMSSGAVASLDLGCYKTLPLKPVSDFVNSYYIRLKVKDEPRVFASIALFFAEADISFASIIQKPRHNRNAEIVLVTHPCKESQLNQALASLRAYSKLEKVYNIIRIEN